MKMNGQPDALLMVAKLLGLLLLIAALAAGCSPKPQGEATAQQADPNAPKTVKVQTVSRQKISEPREQVGEVSASVELDVTLKAGGEVKEVLKKKGEAVQEGEVLFRLDTKTILLEKEKAELSLRSAQYQLDKQREDSRNETIETDNSIAKTEQSLKDAVKAYNKTLNEYDLGTATDTELESAKTTMDNLQRDLDLLKKKRESLDKVNPLTNLEIQLESSRVSLAQIEDTLANYEVKAPTSGVLVDLSVEPGMTVQSGSKVGQVLKTDPVKIKADLTEASMKLIQGKQELNVYPSGESAKAKTKATVTYLSPVMSTSTKSYALELELANPELKWKPGTKVQIMLTDEEEENVIAVPTTSIVRDGSDTYVFVLAGEQAERRKVELGRLHETVQEIISGLKEGEQLIVSGQHQLKDKEKVQLAK